MGFNEYFHNLYDIVFWLILSPHFDLVSKVFSRKNNKILCYHPIKHGQIYRLICFVHHASHLRGGGKGGAEKRLFSFSATRAIAARGGGTWPDSCQAITPSYCFAWEMMMTLLWMMMMMILVKMMKIILIFYLLTCTRPRVSPCLPRQAERRL